MNVTPVSDEMKWVNTLESETQCPYDSKQYAP